MALRGDVFVVEVVEGAAEAGVEGRRALQGEFVVVAEGPARDGQGAALAGGGVELELVVGDYVADAGFGVCEDAVGEGYVGEGTGGEGAFGLREEDLLGVCVA